MKKGEADDVLEIEDEPPISTTTFQVDKTLQVLKQLTQLCKKETEMRQAAEKANASVLKEIMRQKERKIINQYFNKL